MSVGLTNILTKKITIPAKGFICQVQLANMVSKLHDPVGQVSTKSSQEENESWTLEQEGYNSGRMKDSRLLKIFSVSHLIHFSKKICM